MQVWTSAEAMIDIEAPLRFASNELERALNASVGCEDYGSGVSKWALIYIIMDEDDPAYPEVRRYKKRTGVVEFRLKVDHQAFKEADARTHRKLLAAAVLRTLDLSGELKIAGFDAERFKRDVVQALKNNEWT
jgi:hypothetical protein